MATKKDLEYYLSQARRIAAHREEGAEKEIRKLYKAMLKDLQSFVSEVYVKHSQGDKLTFAMLQQAGYDARFLEEIERRINVATPKAAKELRALVEETYKIAYEGMVDGVSQMGVNGLDAAFAGAIAITPEQIKAAVQNPVSGLTLKDTLEKNRREIIYSIKQTVGVGLMNGDRYSTMARRIAKQVDGDYAKAIRIARTETHRVREAGNHDASVEVDKALQGGTTGMRMTKTWKTMKDERVRPQRRRRGKKGWSTKMGKGANHMILRDQIVLEGEDFDLKDGNKAPVPGSSGVAGHDINCRCYASYEMMTDEEFFAKSGRHFPGNKGKETEEEEATMTRKEMRERIKEDKSLIGDAKSRMRAVDRDIDKHLTTEFDDLKGLKKSDITGRIKAIEDREKEIDPIVSKLYDRPERGTPEYDAWREWKRGIDRESIIEEQIQLAAEKAKLQSQLGKFDRFDEWKKWTADHPLEALKSKRTSLADEIKRLEDEIKDFEARLAANPVLDLVDKLEDNGVAFREVKKHAKQLTESEIIAALAGGDMTTGSCASVGIAYIGQRSGLDVLDFRGGESMRFFSGKMEKLQTFRALGATPIEESSAKSSLTNGKRILSQMVKGKEYYLSVGRHASIVRLSDDGVPQYLELQSASRSGWQNFASDVRETLKWRFGCTSSSSFWNSAYLTDLDQFADNDDFRTLLGYINTSESEERKGRHGTIK